MLLLLSLIIIIISVGVVHGCVNCPLLKGQFVWSLLVCNSYIVHCPESRGCRISEVANTLCQWQFQLVLCCLSIVRRLPAFRGFVIGGFTVIVKRQIYCLRGNMISCVCV